MYKSNTKKGRMKVHKLKKQENVKTRRNLYEEAKEMCMI